MFLSKELDSKPDMVENFEKDSTETVKLSNSEIEHILFCMSVAFHEELGDDNMTSNIFKKMKVISPKVSFYYDFLEKDEI
jgi:hypothetical protein